MKRFQILSTTLLFATSLSLGCSSDDTGGVLGSGGDAMNPTGTGGATSGASSGGLGSGAAPSSGGTAAGSGGASVENCGDPTADTCDFAAGVTHVCKRRFALGVNYAWNDFGTDFGGLAAWSQLGLSKTPSVATDLAAMAAGGVSVVRWWMFPNFAGDGVTFDAGGDPSGLSADAVADIRKALELADQNDLYLTLTIFSFDNFKPTTTVSGVNVRGMQPMVIDATRRKKLIDNVVRPIAKAVVASPYAHRLFAWDLINEPEWAIAKAGLPSNDFDPNPELQSVTLAQMKTFISEVAAALGEEAPGTKRSVGWAAAKWAGSFQDISGLEFHQPHIYSWVNDYWPYTQTPAQLGYGDKPTIMGEFYLKAMPLAPSASASYSTIVGSWFDAGFAGAWAWQFNENAADIGLISTFASTKGCQTAY